MPSCSEPAIGWPPMNRAAPLGAAARRPRRRPGAFTDPTSVTSGTPASSSCTTASAIAPTGSATNATSAPRAACREIVARPIADRAQLVRAREPVAVAVEADDLVSELGEREPDRAADQARADDRDAHDYSGRSSRSDRAPSRYT